MAFRSFVEKFATDYSVEFPNILKAQEITNNQLDTIRSSMPTDGIPIFSSDVDLVLFGSIARRECTAASDVDWTILIDGQASPEHYEISTIIKEKLLEAKLVPPGPSGLFGQITFSHDLIHYIGGEDDTNYNITRRILLLLESVNVNLDADERHGTAYERVVQGIVNEYITNDSGFRSASGEKARVPRFLLNDIIRFWRTMCVDFAYKQKSQRGEKWALRNIKLRLSRKLLFVKGLLMCFSCFENPEDLRRHLAELSKLTPLDVIVKVLGEVGTSSNEVKDLLTAYDEFLGMLNDVEKRSHLSQLQMDTAYNDGIFIEARSISVRFQTTLLKVFLEDNSKLKDFTAEYGVF